MRVLVTGAGGFVGGHLVPRLVDEGYELRLVSQSPGSVSGLEVEACDITDRDALHGMLVSFRPEGVIHLAGQASVPKSWQDPAVTFLTNVVGTSYLLDGLRDSPSTRVLLVGSGQQYGPSMLGRPIREDDPVLPASPYAISKLAQEQAGMLYMREFGINVIATRSFNHTGPGQGPHYAIGAFCQQIVELKQGLRDRIEVGYLGNRRDYLDVRDVVDAYIALMKRGKAGEVYNVCSGVGRPIGELLDELLKIAGVPDAEVSSELQPREGDPELLVGDPSKIRADVGWEPRIPISESLSDTLDWYRATPQTDSELGANAVKRSAT